MLRRHSASVNRAATNGAVLAGYGWWYFLGIFALVLVVVWALAIVFHSLVMIGIAVLVSLSIVPPLLREWRRRGEVRKSMGRRPQK